MAGTINEILERVKSTTWFKSYEKQNTKGNTAKLRGKIRAGIKAGKYKEYYPENRKVEDDRGFELPKRKISLGKKAVYPKQQKIPVSKSPYKQEYNQREDVKEYNRQRKRAAYQKKKQEKK